ncbi:MAG: hypothetical protein RLZ37_750, partial [Actinomycetota bacterium]
MNLASIVDPHDADAPAIISRGRATSYGELRHQIEAFRGSLMQMEIKPGDRVAMLCGNGRWFVVAYLATVGMGAIAVPLNPLSPTPELEGELETVDPIAILVEASGVSSFSAVDRSKLVSLRQIIITDENSADAVR